MGLRIYLPAYIELMLAPLLAVGVGEMFLTCKFSAFKVILWPGERKINRICRNSSLSNLGLKVIIKITI